MGNALPRRAAAALLAVSADGRPQPHRDPRVVPAPPAPASPHPITTHPAPPVQRPKALQRFGRSPADGWREVPCPYSGGIAS